MHLVIVFAAMALAAGAARGEWEPVGPYGGFTYVMGIVGNDVFAAGRAGLWRSSDQGLTWTCSPSVHPWSDLAASGPNMYGVNGGRLLKSGDRGTTWAPLPERIPRRDSLALNSCSRISVMGRYLFAGTFNGIYRSSDGGSTWMRVDGFRDSSGSDTLPSYGAFAQQGAYIYASTVLGLFFSPDSGAAGTWRRLPTPGSPAGADGSDVAVLALGRYLFASKPGSFSRSADHGLTWEALEPVETETYLTADGPLLYRETGLHSQTDLHVSRDSGLTWTRLYQGGRLSEISIRGNTLFVSQGADLLRSLDGGRHFEACPIPATSFQALYAAGNRLLAPGRVMDASWTPGLEEWDGQGFASEDQGRSWAYPLEWPEGGSIAFLAREGDLGFALAKNQKLMLSRNGGKDWETLPPFFPIIDGVAPIEDLAIHRGNLFAARNDFLYASIDSGATWTQSRRSLFHESDWKRPRLLFPAGEDLFIVDTGGVFRSADGGGTWTRTNLGITGHVRSLTSVAGALIAAGDGGVFRSANRGDAWTRVDSGHRGFMELEAAGGALFAIADSQGVFLSRDAGATWRDLNQGLPAVRRVTAIATTGSYVHIAIQGMGIWRRPLQELIPLGTSPRRASAPNRSGSRRIRSGDWKRVAFALPRSDRDGRILIDSRGRRVGLSE